MELMLGMIVLVEMLSVTLLEVKGPMILANWLDKKLNGERRQSEAELRRTQAELRESRAKEEEQARKIEYLEAELERRGSTEDRAE